MPDHQLHKRLIRGLSANAISQLQNVTSQLLLVPIFLTCWGKERYGEWLLLSVIPSTIILADFGMNTAVSNELVLRVSKGRIDEARVLYSGLLAFLFLSSLIILALSYPLTTPYVMTEWLGLATERAESLSGPVLCLVIYALLILVMTTLSASLNSVKQYALSVNLNTAQRAAEVLTTILVLIFSGSLNTLCFTLLVVRSIGFFIALQVVYRAIHWLPAKPSLSAAFQNRATLLSGLAFMSFPVGNAMLNQGVLLVIGLKLDSAAVASFSVVRSLTRLVTQLLNVVIQAFQAEITHAYAQHNLPLLRELARQTFRYAFWLGSVACLTIAIFGPWFLIVWTRKELEIDSIVLWTLAFAQAITTIWLASAITIAGTNNHQRTSIIFLLVAGGALLLSMICVEAQGLRGIAMVLVGVELVMAVFVIRSACSITGDPLITYLFSPFQLTGIRKFFLK